MSDRPVQIIGAGIAGLTAAVECARAGHRVEVFERASESAAYSAPGGTADDAFNCSFNCSGHAGGMLAPWCELDAPPAVVEMGVRSLPWWQHNYPAMVQHGTLLLAAPRDSAELERCAAHTTQFRRLDGTEIAALEPDLAGRFRAGLFYEAEAHVNPRAALPALVAAARTRGVVVHFDSAFANGDHEHGWVIDCRGLAARDALKDLRGVRGEMLVVKTHDLHLSRPVRLAHPRFPVYIVPRGNGLFMVGATTIESESCAAPAARSIVELLSAAYTLHPAFGEAAVVELGAGLRPAFPDNVPRLRPCGRTLYINGLYRHGFLTAPALAMDAARLIAEAGDAHATYHQRGAA